MPPDLEDAVRQLGARHRRAAQDPNPVPALDAAFRAAIDERLRALERQVDEIKGRINGLLFLLAGAVATQVVLRVFV